MTLSATYPDKLAEIAEQLMRSPQHIRLAQENQVKIASSFLYKPVINIKKIWICPQRLSILLIRLFWLVIIFFFNIKCVEIITTIIFSSIASKLINICWIRTSSQPYWKFMCSITLHAWILKNNQLVSTAPRGNIHFNIRGRLSLIRCDKYLL